MTSIARTPLGRTNTMDETIHEALNFLGSGGRTYGDEEAFPVSLGKRAAVTRDSIVRSSSPKRTRKSPVRFPIRDEPEDDASTPAKSSKPRATRAKSPRKARSPKRTTTKPKSKPMKKPVASKRRSAAPVAIPVSPTFDMSDLEALRLTRKMKNTGEDERITEIVFSFDTTGSMGAAITEAKKNIVEITNRLFDTVTGLRVGVIAHGDYCDSPGAIFQVKPLCDDKAELVAWINKAQTGGGGDAPENYEQVLEYCNEHMNWTAGSHRVLVAIGDQVPHEPAETLSQMKRYKIANPRAIDWRAQLESCWENGIKIYAVQAHTRPHANQVRYFYEALAAHTCGTRVELQNFPVVTDMLLMVCFRESDRMAFDNFRAEVTREGRMDAEREAMFDMVAL